MESDMQTETASDRANAKADSEIYQDLVETLFATRGSFLSGLAAGLLAPIIAWLSTGQDVYFQLILLMTCMAAYRIVVFVAYTREPVVQRRQDARRWEIRYAIGGVGFMAAVGVTAAVLFVNQHDEMVAYYGVILMAGCAGALASRNAGRPMIVFGQVIGACAPLAIVCLFYYSFWYWGLTLVLIFGMISVKSTTAFLHANLEAALRNGYEAVRQQSEIQPCAPLHDAWPVYGKRRSFGHRHQPPRHGFLRHRRGDDADPARRAGSFHRQERQHVARGE